MKHSLLLLLLILIGFSNYAQTKNKKTKQRHKSGILKIKPKIEAKKNIINARVARITCASYIIQIMDNHKDLGELWSENEANKEEGFVNIINKCDIPTTIKVGDPIQFIQIDSKDVKVKDCMVCMMYDSPPSKTMIIKIIE